MSSAAVKLWAINELADNIVKQLTLFPTDQRAIKYCIKAAESIKTKIAEVQATSKKLQVKV